MVDDLKDVAQLLKDIQSDSTEIISEVEASLSQFYLKECLESVILATRIGRCSR